MRQRPNSFAFQASCVGTAIQLIWAATAAAQAVPHEFGTRDEASKQPPAAPSLIHPDTLSAASEIPGKLRIKAFRFTGVTQLPVEALDAAIAGYRERELSTRDLLQAASAVAEVYLHRGMMARVQVRSIVIAEGVAELSVEELRVGRLKIDYPDATRIRRELVESHLPPQVLAPGHLLPLADLERGVEVLNSLPGVAAAAGLDGGAQPGDIDITIRLTDRPIVSGRVYLDNHGVREIGQERLGLVVRADNALGLTERFALEAETASGSSLLAPSIGLPVGNQGARAALQLSSARFRARRAGAAIELRGQFDKWNASFRQSLLRGSPLSLRAEYSLQGIEYRDASLFGNLQHRRVHAATVKFDGIARNPAGTARFELELARGSADLSRNSGDYTTDASSSRIHGGFWHLRWRLAQEMVSGRNSLVLRANGQLADSNLDASQQFALGGHDAVRAYPTAEALGDGGWLATIEWRHQFNDSIVSRLFADTGGIQRNARPWTNQRNRYELSGVGAGLTWSPAAGMRLAFDAARQVGGNAGRNADGSDSDGSNAKWRAWLSLGFDI